MIGMVQENFFALNAKSLLMRPKEHRSMANVYLNEKSLESVKIL